MAERKKVGELRPSQLITTFGPGAIVDLPNLSAMVAGIDYWNTRICTPISEPRLQAKLGIKKIMSPPIPVEQFSSSQPLPTLPVFRFPEYMVCPTCRRLDHYTCFAEPKGDGVLWCHHLGTKHYKTDPPAKAFPVRFIVACPRGHIQDFPWNEYVHAKKEDAKPCNEPHLFLVEQGATGSISNVVIECRTCNTKRTLEDAFLDKDPKTLGPCNGRRPWLGKHADEYPCRERLRAMLRGASNAYFPIVLSALTIPPHAGNSAYEILGELEDFLSRVESLDELKQYWKLFWKAHQMGITPEQLWEAWQNQQTMAREGVEDLYEPEWQELLKGSQVDGEYDFETVEQEVPDLFKGHIARLIQVRRLREVRVLSGFTRIDPPADVTTLLSGEADMQPVSTRAPITRHARPEWLPGIMVRGEGIFIALHEAKVKEWERRLSSVEKAMETAYAKFCEDRNLNPPPPFPGVRYVLLHTLAHVLIRQLGLNSGYSSTALRERIYCRNTPGKEMAGILIYTATPDSEGSLGGLVDQGETHKFAAALWQALHEAQFCSSDPLCAEHDMQEHGDLNGAACHACALVAETSCERSNRFLDRSFLVPTVASKEELAFFKECLS